MKKYNLLIMITVYFLTSIVHVQAQGIKGFVERLDKIEEKLELLDNSQNSIITENADLLSKYETNLRAVQAKVEKNNSNTISPALENSVEEMSSDLLTLRKEVATLKDELLRIDECMIPDNAVTDLMASFTALKSDIEVAFAANQPVPVNTVNAAAVPDEVLKSDTPMNIETSADAAFSSKYVWRGILLTDDAVTQPSATFASGGVSLNVWSSMDLTDVNGNDKEVNELDYTLDYSVDVSSLSLSTGIVQYTFPNTSYDITNELYLGLSSEQTGNASLTLFQDVGIGEGSYLSFGHGTSIPLKDITNIDISGALGWGSAKHNNFYYGQDGGAVTDFLVSARFSFDVGGYISVCPSVSFSSIVNGKIRETVRNAGSKNDIFFYGLALSGAF
jgi:hypothetical protein